MRVYFSENEHEWSRSRGTHYGCKVKFTKREYMELCERSKRNTFGYLGDPYNSKTDRYILFTSPETALDLFYQLGIIKRYRRENVCIEIRYR